MIDLSQSISRNASFIWHEYLDLKLPSHQQSASQQLEAYLEVGKINEGDSNFFFYLTGIHSMQG